MVDEVKALIFDVFGTVVDWRSSIARIAGDFAAKNGVPPANWDQFARDWRGLEVARGETPVRPAVEGRTGVASGYAQEERAEGGG